MPDSVADPLVYYLNNTAMARQLIECTVKAGVQHFIFSSTAAVYGDPEHNPVTEDETLKPMSPYGRSKLMVEWYAAGYGAGSSIALCSASLFQCRGCSPQGLSGQSTPNATHLIKVAVQAALGHRSGMEFSARITRPRWFVRT